MQDTLSDILQRLDAHSSISTGLAAGGEWAMRMSPFAGLKFNAVVRGEAWLVVEGEEPVQLHAGDAFILTRGSAFTLARSLDLEPLPAAEVFANPQNGIARMGEDESFFALGGRMVLDPVDAELLLGALPAVIVLRAASGGARALGWLLDRLVSEVAMPRPGGEAIKDHLMHLMFVEGLRAHLAEGEAKGWLGALSDRRIGQVLGAIHAEPARQWTLPMLAGIAGMSRANFALRFKEATGIAPVDYVTQWRMRLAAKALRQNGGTVSATAMSLGYGSEAAFSTAFRRHHGVPPSHYRKAAAEGPQSRRNA